MWRRNILYLLIFISLLIIQTSFGSVGLWANKMNLVSAFVIACMLYNSFTYGLVLTLISGIYLDIYSGLNFGLITTSLFLAVITVYLLAKHTISYNSIWSILLLIILVIVFYNFDLLILSYIVKQFRFGIDIFHIYFIDIFWQCGLNVMATVFVYSIRNYLKRHMIFYEK
ncbi:MAG: hypothetical protein V1898_04375 [Patescibacteria group bacterium]